jgi:subtilisin family serine protease
MLKLDQCFEALDYMASLSDSCNIRAVSNSWTSGSNPGNVPDYIEASNTMLSLGIINVYCNGNIPSTPRPGSVWMCASIPNVIGVGNTDSLDTIYPSSALGPSEDKEPWTNTENWLRDDWNLIKPNIAAPGTDIWSCSKTSDYCYKTGTSMATPHMAGVIAIMTEKNPDLTPEEIYDILMRSTDQPAANGPYPNNTFGWGRLNAYKALELTSTPIKYHQNTNRLKTVSLATCQGHGIVKVSFSLLYEHEVKIGIIDARGKHIADIVSGRYSSGGHVVYWNTEQTAPGMYLCRLSADKLQVTKKIVLVK